MTRNTHEARSKRSTFTRAGHGALRVEYVGTRGILRGRSSEDNRGVPAW